MYKYDSAEHIQPIRSF